MSDCRHSISLSEGPVLNKRCIEATLIRNDDGSTCFDPGLYSTPKTTDASAGVELNLSQTLKPSDHRDYHLSKPNALYDPLPSHKRALLAHLPCGCRAYADDTDLGTYHRQMVCKAGMWPSALTRNWCRSIETLTGATCCDADNSAKERIGLHRQNSTPPPSSSQSRRRLNCELDPSIIRWAVTRQNNDQQQQQQQRPRSMPEAAARADEARVGKGRVNLDDDLPQVVTECRPLISLAAVTHGCLYQSPSMTYAVATLPMNQPRATTPRFPNCSSLKGTT